MWSLLLIFVLACATPTEVGGASPTDAVPVTTPGEGDGVFVDHSKAPETRILQRSGDDVAVLVDDGGSPDRPALSPDGEWLAYVSAPGHFAGVYVLRIAGGTPRRLTNRDLVAAPGGPPDGWVPLPMEPPAFVGDDLVWQVRGAIHRVAWR